MSFYNALTSHGLRPKIVAPDGRWHRCATDDKPRKRNGAYMLTLDGQRGWFKNWATDLEFIPWSDGVNHRKTQVNHERIAKANAENAKRLRNGTANAAIYYKSSIPLRGTHPYLSGKGLSVVGTTYLRVHADGNLVVPVLNAGRIVSVQKISATGEKRFFTNAPTRGGYLQITRPKSALTVFVEGLATGLAVYQSMPMASVVVCFNTGNMPLVVQNLKPTGAVVIAADNDAKTEARIGVNPGIEAAQKAADVCGAGIAYPEGIDGSDWADFLQEVGEGADRKLARLIQAKAKYVRHGMK